MSSSTSVNSMHYGITWWKQHTKTCKLSPTSLNKENHPYIKPCRCAHLDTLCNPLQVSWSGNALFAIVSAASPILCVHWCGWVDSPPQIPWCACSWNVHDMSLCPHVCVYELLLWVWSGFLSVLQTGSTLASTPTNLLCSSEVQCKSHFEYPQQVFASIRLI